MATINYHIGLVDDGLWLAVSDQEPIFCVRGNSQEQVVAVADRALAFYRGRNPGRDFAIPPKSLSTFHFREKIERDLAPCD